MATKITISHGFVRCVYDDRLMPLLEALGVMAVRRASNVEFNHATEEWEARLHRTGDLIAHGKNRNEVIQQEVEYLEGGYRHLSHVDN